jgi:hypothetical protein
MKTAVAPNIVAPNIRPDRSEGGELPTLVPNLPDGARAAIDTRWLDPTQGSKIGSDPYDDPTQGRRIGSDPYDDPTRGR